MASSVAVSLLFLALAVMAAAEPEPPDPMETFGDTVGSAGDQVDSAASASNADRFGEGAGNVVKGSADAAGDVGVAVGAHPDNAEQVPVVGKAFKVDSLSTSLSCVINLSVQFFIIYTALAVARTVADMKGLSYDSDVFVEVLNQGALTVNYAPMLACLFLACRMRVNWLTNGKANPPTHVQVCMLACTYAVLGMTLVALVIPIFTGETYRVHHETGDLGDPHDHRNAGDHPMFKNVCVALGFTVLKYIIMVMLYVGVTIVIFGIINYVPPRGSWPGDRIPPAAPAVACTMILTSMYFIVYACIQIGKTFTSFSGVDSSKITGALQGAICTMAFAPMLSILFIAARMRALQMDPITGQPQSWAQNCFYACTYAVMLQCILAVAVPLVLGGEVKMGGKGEGDVEYDVGNKWCGIGLEVVRWIVMLSVYLGFMCVIWSIFTIQHPKGAQFTPPISVTMQCVTNLTVQYFIVYLLIWVCVTVKELTGWEWKYLSNTMENAKGTIAFCPMLAILFVGVRMRALRLTDNRGAPQGWVQEGMFCATWAILIQFLMVLLVPLATYLMEGEMVHHEVDADGNTKWQPKSEGIMGKILFFMVQAVRWLGFFLLYGGVIAVIAGAITMTPETANGRGSLPLVRETPFGGEPLGPNDIPGMPPQGGAPPQDTTSAE